MANAEERREATVPGENLPWFLRSRRSGNRPDGRPVSFGWPHERAPVSHQAEWRVDINLRKRPEGAMAHKWVFSSDGGTTPRNSWLSCPWAAAEAGPVGEET